MIIQGNNPYDGRPVFILITCIVIAVVSLIVLTVKICKRKKKRSTGTITFFSIILACCIGGIIFIGVGRKAKNNDIYIDLDQKISLNMDFNVHSYENINDLEVTFVFRNKDGAIISTKVKTIGDVKRNKNYVVTIKFTEFTITEIMKIERISAYVSDGRTAYI